MCVTVPCLSVTLSCPPRAVSVTREMGGCNMLHLIGPHIALFSSLVKRGKGWILIGGCNMLHLIGPHIALFSSLVERGGGVREWYGEGGVHKWTTAKTSAEGVGKEKSNCVHMQRKSGRCRHTADIWSGPLRLSAWRTSEARRYPFPNHSTHPTFVRLHVRR